MASATFAHIGVVCKDPIKLEKFYTKHFGFTRARVFAPGPDQVVIIRSGNVAFELFKATAGRPDQAPTEAGPMYPCWRHVCFIVDDLEAKLKELGDEVRVTLGPLDMGQFVPGMKVVWVADPEGNIIELNQGYRDEGKPPPLR